MQGFPGIFCYILGVKVTDLVSLMSFFFFVFNNSITETDCKDMFYCGILGRDEEGGLLTARKRGGLLTANLIQLC